MLRRLDIHPAFVFNTFFNGLGVIRALGKSGISVYALDTHRSVGTYSRYANYWICPDASTSEDKFVDFLIEKRQQFSLKPLLFPTNDDWAAAISRHKDVLSEYFFTITADWDVLRLLIEKNRFFSWAQERGYPVPKTYFNIDEIDESLFPIVAKPIFRRMSTNSEHNRRFRILLDRLRLVRLNTMEDFNKFRRQYERILPYLIFQEEVVGMANRMYTVGIYADKNSELLAIFTGRKVRGFPPNFGDCIVGQTEPLPELVELTRKLIKDLKYNGVAEVEFKKDARTEEYKLLEVNARSWSWIGITPACGVNIPLIAYNDAVLGQKSFYQSRCGIGEVKWVRLIDDFSNCTSKNRQIGFPEEHLNFAKWLNSLKGRRVIAEFDITDPYPGIWYWKRFLKRKRELRKRASEKRNGVGNPHQNQIPQP